jgi:hypothetical protein
MPGRSIVRQAGGRMSITFSESQYSELCEHVRLQQKILENPALDLIAIVASLKDLIAEWHEQANQVYFDSTAECVHSHAAALEQWMVENFQLPVED